MGRRYLILFISFCLALPAQGHDIKYYYLVQKHDQASEVLYRAQIKPIYGKMGTLALVQRLNASHIPNINKISPGAKLFFPDYLALYAKQMGSISITARNEIIFANNEITRLPSAEVSKMKSLVLPSPTDPVQSAADSANRPHLHQADTAQSAAEVSFETGFSRIDSAQNNGSATLLSKPKTGVHLQWRQFWSDDWQSFVGWGTSSISFADTSQGFIISGQKQTTSRFGFGVTHQLTPILSATLEVGAKEEIFAPSFSAGTATLETKPVTYLKLAFTRDLVEVRRLRLNAFLGGSYLLGLSNSAYDIKPGHAYLAGLRLTHKLKSFSIFASGSYGESFQNTSLSTQSQKGIQSELGLTFPFADDETTKEKSP